jgi:hypothetical protein
MQSSYVYMQRPLSPVKIRLQLKIFYRQTKDIFWFTFHVLWKAICLWLYKSFYWTLASFSARRKAATYTQNNTNTDIHALSRIRTHDPSIRASEDSSCFRPLLWKVKRTIFANTRIVYLPNTILKHLRVNNTLN